MKILIVGAGVLGSLYAARLKEAGEQVAVLARGQRLAEIRQNGIVLIPEGSETSTTTKIDVIDRLEADDFYDLAIVLVRKNQLASVLPVLSANRAIPTILFMVNNAAGPETLIDAVGRERVMLGFPGAGGAREAGIVHYRIVSFQPTTLGELNGASSQRLEDTAQALRAAGFPVKICPDMDAWLKTHIAIVSPVANAIYLAGGSTHRLARTRDGLLLMLRAVRENFQVLHNLNIPVIPPIYRILEWIPEPLLIPLLQRGLSTSSAELVLARHANAARDEMQALAGEFQALSRYAGTPTPAFDELCRYIDLRMAPLPDGERQLPINWRQMAGWLILAGILLLGRWLLRKRSGRISTIQCSACCQTCGAPLNQCSC